MRPRIARWTLLGLLSAIPATGILPTPANGQVGAASVSFAGRVQTQFNTTSADDPVGSEFLIRRARITAVIKINDLISGRIQPDYGAGKISLKDAYFKLAFSPYANVTIGQFKRAFDLFELTSSTQTLVIEREGSIRGVNTCSGIGGVCSFSRFTEKLGYSDRDIGVRVDGALGNSSLEYQIAITNGAGANKPETNSNKAWSARLEYGARDDLTVAANVSYHDYANEVDPSRVYGRAYGLDVEWGSYGALGWHIKGGVITGDNWKALSEDGTPRIFRSAQAMITHKFGVTSTEQLSAIEPLLRLSWADPDTGIERDREVFATTGVVFHFVGRNKIAANLELWDPAVGDPEWSLKIQSYIHF